MKKPSRPNESILSVEHLSFSYGDKPLFKDISFTVNDGDYVTVLGPNGGGKSTLAKLIIGLLLPSEGRVRIRGLSPGNAGHLIGYVPQYMNFDTHFPISVFNTVLTGAMNRPFGFYTREERLAASGVLEAVGLEALSRASFAEISGGQRQRTMIARALVGNPELLILDEPTAGVDVAIGQDLEELLRRLNEKLTILMITHDFGFVDKAVSRVFCVNNNVIEHPIEEVDENLILSSYGRGVKSVRHDVHLGDHR
ncbi:MAG: ABC transporter ATP-binding protein [Spirochaetales bacterium]|nr:ABC transporter ATP-binding protein [Spirochaetales bacterium]